uniref:RING-type E3 ubiquitin transferase n=1 Tax=Myotis lucifugus TaxID=59463 RepID=G1Q694_MYOLU
MEVLEEPIPPLSAYQCKICLEILVEPVTLPCDHTLCKPCFQSIVEKSNLCCPFCRFWIAGWTRYHTRKNSLVNMQLWENIKKHYPEECNLRVSLQESQANYNDAPPVHLISEPGELRREYEEEKRKMEALQRAKAEEENKASEEYIQQLLAEDEEKRKREIERQLKNDKALARKISFDINFDAETAWASNRVITRSQTKIMNQQENTGDIQEYLSPISQYEPVSLSEGVKKGKKNSMSKESESSHIKSPMCQGTEIKEDIPTLSSQICHEIQEQGATSSVESPMPQLCASGTELCLGEKVKMKPNMEEISETENEESYPQSSEKDVSKRKTQESLFETAGDPGSSVKRGRMFPEASSDQSHHHSNLLDLGHVFFERENQEEQDKLSALNLRKEVDENQIDPTLPKGSPDE